MIGHAAAIDAARDASDALLRSNLTDDQKQLVVDMMNATQDLNTLYWEQAYTFSHLLDSKAITDYHRKQPPLDPWDVAYSVAIGDPVTIRFYSEDAAMDAVKVLERGFAPISGWRVTAVRVANG